MASDRYMKGVDVYSWKDDKGVIWYSLLPGTNRQKSIDEILKSKSNSSDFEAKFSKLPEGTSVFWNNAGTISNDKPATAHKQSLQFVSPPKDVFSKIKNIATQSKLNLTNL